MRIITAVVGLCVLALANTVLGMPMLFCIVSGFAYGATACAWVMTNSKEKPCLRTHSRPSSNAGNGIRSR